MATKIDFGDAQHLSELRIVLMGYRRAGKSSAGNSILCREEFDLKRSAQCVRRHGEVADRHITVIEAPGWWRNYTVEKSPELLKQEIVFSVSLCPPGPHAVLLIIPVDTGFKETERKAVQEHLDLLGERVWSHTIVLFTGGDSLSDTSIEQYIESEGQDLQLLLDKCGNRYHVLNNQNRSDDTQIKELLEKIEETVALNNACHFEIDRKILQEMKERRREAEERAKERMKRMKKQRDDIRSQMSDAQHLSELRIVLMGYRRAGKSSAGNSILGREEFDLKRSAQCVRRHGEVADRHITVIEAPGWWRTYTVEESPELLKQEIVFSVSLCPPGSHTVLLIIPVDTRFKETERKAVQGHLDLLGERVWSHTIVLFTRGDSLSDTSIEQYIESEGQDLQRLLDKCGNRYHVLNNQNRSDDTQIKELLEKIEETVALNNSCHFEIDRKILQEMRERRREAEERAKERMKRMKKQRDDIRPQMSDAQHLSELRIVLMGSRRAGKSSAGNSILCREEFDLKTSAQCVRRHGEVADRHITVIEAPGWYRNYTVEESPELLKQEIVFSVSLCPPGPHAVLLIIRVDIRFKETERKAVQGYLDLLGERVWSHTIVLFTRGDSLSDTSIEQYIESEGQDLQRLLDKCGNRYHVLNNQNRNDDTQIKELLEKIEETVALNNGCHFEIDRKILQEMRERRRAAEERAKERMKRMKKQRDDIRSQMSDAQHVSELRIVLMGSRDAGKSSAGNSILCREEFDLETSAQCVRRHGEVADRHITVIEAPGWWRTYTVEESPELLKQEIVFSVSLCPPGPHAVLLIIPVDTRFKETERKAVQGHLDLLGERVWSHTIVLFTGGDSLSDTSIEQYIESEGQDLQRLLDKCGNRYHVLNNQNRNEDTQIKELLEKIEETVALNNACHFEIDRKILQEIKERRRAAEERAKERMKRMKKQRDDIRPQMSDAQHLSELRIVLMGYRAAGKSSAGNSILGRDEFDLKTSAQCVRRHGEVADRHIIVIEAPGWWRNYTVEESSELLKQEIVFSVSLCPPGPHAVLLIIPVDTGFKETDRKVLQGHLDLLGERVWSHTIVLFTRGDSLSDTSIEQYIESEGQDLQRLLDKCGNRYHVLSNQNRSNDTQIKELLQKIEETVAQNNGCHFEIDRKILQELKERRREAEERAKERMKRMKKQRDDIRPQMSDAQHLSELRIVLMGSRAAGKSSAGNSILSREEFDLKRSAQCVRRHGEVADRHITVIEAPGWWRNYTVEESSELLKQEIVFSVSLCPPGPHAVLLIIPVDTGFKETERKAVQGHLDLLSERVWSHTIVLFTRGDSLSDTSIEQYIESEGQDLQRLLDKCGNRYHVLNNQNRSEDTQIKELLEKIEETVAQNNGCHFEIDRKILQKMKERRREAEERAKERMKRMKKQRDDIRSQMSDAQHLSELRIVLMGSRAAGKSSAGNSILGREEFDLKRSAQCVRRHGEVADRHIIVIEAPGWWRNHIVEESPELLKQEIVLSVSLCPPGPHTVLLIIRVDTRFKETDRKAVQGHLDLLGERVWSHTIVLFTCGDSLSDTSIEQHIESEGQDLQRLLDKCGNRYHVLNNQNRSEDTQIKELLEKIEETVAQNYFAIRRKISLIKIQGMDNRIKSEEQMQPWRDDVKSQCFSGAEGSDSCSLASSAYGSFRSSEADISSIYGSSQSMDTSLISRFKSGVRKTFNSMELTPPLMSRDERLNTLESSASSFISQSEADIRSSYSRDSYHTRKYESNVLNTHNSMEIIPPLMSGDDRLDTRSVGSSAYGSFRSLSGADSGSVFSSSRLKVSSHSSGFGSVQTISESVKDPEPNRAEDVPKISKHEHKDTD
ncbi:uncharacterized protein LOC127947454 isoform X7 [Carassius gibelio]|uniref:uncharacterized protein LOC127947454 isoform X7 n=1 Tax=Carassius gibelio TaxID=101364 RepID=UPI002279451E|nr:uncharacterized protein LOC127947454 isoform X7 [Carassius gibelio]